MSVSDLIALRDRYKFTIPAEGETHDHMAYSVLAVRPEDQGRALIGLKVRPNGGFGNVLLAYSYAVLIAQHFGLHWVQLSDTPGFQVRRTVSGSPTILGAQDPLPAGGVFLEGPFWGMAPFGLDQVAGPTIYKTVQSYLRTHVLAKAEARPRSELTIHLRAGDIFAHYVHPVYVQPPLAFYTRVIAELLQKEEINRVRLVFEDRANPCVDLLEAHLVKVGLPYEVLSGNLVDDLSAVASASHVAFGLGTFAPAACYLADRITTAHYFWPAEPSGLFPIPSINRAYQWNDAAGGYPRAGDWANTPEQRELMVSYPENALVQARVWA